MSVIALHADNPGHMTGGGNWTYLIDGAAPVLIDAGVGQPRSSRGAVRRMRRTGRRMVLVTHAHPDHASGAPAIAARAPRARFAKGAVARTR